VRSIIAERETLEVKCEFCNRAYHYDSVDAEQLFAAAVPPPTVATRH
jgi:molecular chaperone Hsp33